MWIDRELIIGPFVALCTSEREFKRAQNDIGFTGSVSFMATSHANATAHHFTNLDGKPVTVICLGDVSGRSSIEIAGLLIHEAVHVWQNYCEYIGESSPSQEFEAYGIQCIAQRLLEAYAERVG